MKITDFRNELRATITRICAQNGWNVDSEKHRGMAFENWCFDLLSEKYPTHDLDHQDGILRTDDAGIDIFFQARDTQELYILQCKHPRIAQTQAIPEDEVKTFFGMFDLLRDSTYIRNRGGRGSRIPEISSELIFCLENRWTVYFIFASTDERREKAAALEEAFNKRYQDSPFNVRFLVWGINQLKDEYVEIQSIEETYPERVLLTLASQQFMSAEGDLKNLTFVVRGSELQAIAKQYRESLFNWNIRRYLGKKGEVNQGIMKTINSEPENFYSFNNGISALCTKFDFDQKSRRLTIERFQIVNGAQTIGAIQAADPDKLKQVQVLVKLTAIKHFTRETGISADLIRTNNTQNKLSLPDFRSNDKIQLWLEQKFKDTKSRGDLQQIDYGRKKPYPRSSPNKQVMKLQDLGKIRYAWIADPRIPIYDPSSLFELPSGGGLYAVAFGNGETEEDLWTDDQFQDTLLAIHSYNCLTRSLKEIQDNDPELKQISRLKYYALKLFHNYIKIVLPSQEDLDASDLYRFGSKFRDFYKQGEKLITLTLKQAYKEILQREEGTAFSLPRDAKVWELVQAKFADNVELAEAFSKP